MTLNLKDERLTSLIQSACSQFKRLKIDFYLLIESQGGLKLRTGQWIKFIWFHKNVHRNTGAATVHYYVYSPLIGHGRLKSVLDCHPLAAEYRDVNHNSGDVCIATDDERSGESPLELNSTPVNNRTDRTDRTVAGTALLSILNHKL